MRVRKFFYQKKSFEIMIHILKDHVTVSATHLRHREADKMLCGMMLFNDDFEPITHNYVRMKSWGDKRFYDWIGGTMPVVLHDDIDELCTNCVKILKKMHGLIMPTFINTNNV